MRKDDVDNSTYFRSGDRVFCMNGKWFYQTREVDHGPFPTRDAALLDLQRYVDEMAFFDGITGDDAGISKDRKADGYADFSLVDKDPH